jgi:hypothetical protein
MLLKLEEPGQGILESRLTGFVDKFAHGIRDLGPEPACIGDLNVAVELVKERTRAANHLTEIGIYRSVPEYVLMSCDDGVPRSVSVQTRSRTRV